ncbi:MAG: ABC transporter ATP-binding protein [bacterium JZ-2024 1]
MLQPFEPEKEEFRFDREVLREMFRLWKPYRWIFFFALILTLIATSAELAMPIVVRRAIDAHIIRRAVWMDGKLIPIGSRKARAEEKDVWTFFFRGKIADQEWEQLTAPVKKIPQAVVTTRYFALPLSSFSALPEEVKKEIQRVEASRLIPLVGVFLLLILFAFLCSSFSAYLLTFMGQKVIYALRLQVHEFILSQSYGFFLKQPVGKLVTRLTNDVDASGDFFTQVLASIYKDLVMIVGVIAVMWAFHPGLTLVVLSFAPFLLLWLGIFRAQARKNFRRIRTVIAELNATLSEHLLGVREIKLLCAQDSFSRSFSSLNQKLYRAYMKQIHLNSLFFPIVNLVNYLSLAAVLAYGAYRFLHHELSLGVLIAFFVYIEMLYTPIRDLVERYPILQSSLAAAEKIFSLLKGDTRIPEPPPHLAQSLPEIKGEIEFRDVWLAYDRDWVLKGVSFRIQPGEKVAIVGWTGAGKTSLIHLLLKFFLPQKGKILVDGVDLFRIPTGEWRKHCALVPQEEYIFRGTLASNIALFDESIPGERLEACAREARLEWFLHHFPKGWEEPLAERGENLSVGQKQFLSLMRALVRRPALLLLDEATSHLDPESEAHLQEGLKHLLSDRTALLISHRLSTLRLADRILVLHQGCLLESGNHRELLAKNGLYARWVALSSGKAEVFS